MSASYAVASYGGAPSASEQATVTTTTGKGDAVVVLVGSGASGSIVSVTDSQGNSYSSIASNSAQSIGMTAYLGFTNTPLVSGTDWLKVTYTGASTGQQWIARGMAGVNGVDINTSANSPSSASLTLTSASLVQPAEWAIAFAATGNSGGSGNAPSNWTGGFTAQTTVQNGLGSFYTFADKVTNGTGPLVPGASLSPSEKWELIVVSIQFTSVFLVGEANSPGAGTSLAIPVTTPTQPGNTIVVFSKQNSATVTSVTDSTGGNVYTQQSLNSGNTYDVYTHTAAGITQVGAAYSSGSYSDAGGSTLTAAQELDTWMNGGGANWPTPKLTPRTMAFNVLREYYETDPLIKAGSTGWPTDAAHDTRHVATRLTDGVQNVCITFRPARDGTNNYTGGAFTTEFNNLVSSITYITSIFPKAKFTLWHEANIFGTNGPFGNASQDSGLGSPYGNNVSTSQMHANWQAYVAFYGPAFHSAGVPLYWIPSMASPNEAIDFFDIALNATQQGYYTGIGSDNYTGNFIDGAGNIKTTLTQPYGTNGVSMLGLASKYGHPYAIWELGAGSGQTPSANVTFLNQCITQPLVAWLAAGNPISEVLWFNYGGDTIGAGMDPSVLAALQLLYDSLQGTTCALPSGGSITVNWNTGASTKFAAAAAISTSTTVAPDQLKTSTSTGTAPTATTGTLSQSNEVAFAYSVAANASGQITWSGGFSAIGTDHTGTSTFESLAYQVVSSTSPVTAAGTLGVSGGWDINLITFPIASQGGSQSGVTVPKPSLSASGTVANNVTGTGAVSIPKPSMVGLGIGGPGTPYLIGSVSVNAASATINALATVTSGDTIQVGVLVTTASSVPTVGPDTAGNNYSLILSDTTNAGTQLFVFESDGANVLRQGVDSIPVSQTISGQMAAIAVGDDGVFGLDKFVITHGTSAAPASPSTGTLSQPEEHAIGWIVDAAAGGVPTWASPWSTHVLANVDATVAKISVAYQLVTSTTALTASGTITSANWAAACTTTAVTPNTILITPSNGIVGIPYRQTLESMGGDPPVTWSITGSLPPGLTLIGGQIIGVPTTAGSYTYTLNCTDSLSQVTSLVVTVQILAGAFGASPMTALSNNLLSPGDSDFETAGTFTWASYNNAVAPIRTAAIALTGNSSLYWYSAADGPTAIAANAIPVAPAMPYIFSGAILFCGVRDGELRVEWDDVNGNLIQVDTGPLVSGNGGGWLPMQGAFTSPLGAATVRPIVVVNESNAGDLNVIDMMFFTQDSTQVLIDWTNSPFLKGGPAGSAFMDVSPWVRMDGNGITYTLGRQDAISEIPGASGSFDLQSDQGQFSPQNSLAIPVAFGGAVTLQRRVQINFADEHGKWWTRFDGGISEVDPTFDNTGNTALLNVMITDVLSMLSRQDSLFCWTKQQVLTDNPLYHWTLDDSGAVGGAGVAAETSGNNGPALRLSNSDSTNVATIAWEDTSGGVETLADAASATGQDGSAFWVAGSNQPTSPLRGLVSGHVGPFTTPLDSATMTPTGLVAGFGNTWPIGTASAQNTFVTTTGYMLTTILPAPLTPTATGSDYSFEIWMMPDPSIASNLAAKYGPFIAFGLGSSGTKTNLLAGIYLNSGTANFECATYSQPPSFLGQNFPGTATPTATASTSTAFTPDKVKRPHHIVVTIQGDPTAATVTLWLDGVNVGNFALPKGQTYDTVTIGGAYGGCGAFFGNLSIASIYPYLLTTQQITQHCQFGQYGMWEATTDDCIAQLGILSGVPNFWSNLGAGHLGLTMTDYLDITNQNAIAAMQQFEQAEHGLLFVSSQGALTFHTRAWRMGAKQPDLWLPQNTFDANLQYRLLDQFQCNEEGVSGPNTLGANATTLLANPANPGQTQTQTTSSSVIQAGYVNTASQNQYGVYAANPVSSPLTLPLITWSRAYAALGLPAFSFWTDPSLNDRAAWDANSRSDPWYLPAGITIDLLTFEAGPASLPGQPPQPTGISSFFALGIDNIIAPTPSSLPPSFPNAQTSVEWFIEGITETKTINSHTIEFYTSPAEPQRAWIPGDPAYGVLGQTTKLGISASDVSTPQADGKSVSHDAGPPYWPQAFSASMNAQVMPGAAAPPNARGFVGAADMRGIAQNLRDLLKPPMCVVTATSQTQSFTNGALTGTSPPNIATLYWDVLHVDTAGGMGAVPGWPNWYLVTSPGFYEIDGNVTWALTAGQLGYTGQAWIVVAQAAAQAIAAGTGNPLTVNQYVCPVGESVIFNSNSATPVNAFTTRMYLGVGDMVAIAAEQNFSSSRGTAATGAGSAMSLRRVGLSQMDDRTLINSSLGSAGTVTLVSHGNLQQAIFQNIHTYAYMGDKGFTSNGRRNSDLGVYQGLIGAADLGSQAAQIVFNVANIQSTLTGHTALSATLAGTNISSNYSTGAKAMIGTTKDTPGAIKFDPGDSNSTRDIIHQLFPQGGALTFAIPLSIVTALNTGGAKALILGDGDTTDLNYAGQWQGGPSSWTLTVNYV